MNGIYGLYKTPHGAQRAFDALRSAGVSPRHITVMSSEPLEEWEFGGQDRATRMSWVAVLGAAIGLLTAYILTFVTQRAWAINTGGMPIVSNWTNIVIMFELTMLGAVLATVVTLLITARLPSRLSDFYDPAISDGRILVGVANPQYSSAAIQHALRAAHPEAVNEVRVGT